MRKQLTLLVSCLLLAAAVVSAAENPIPSPEDYLGFKVGADRRLARWDSIVEYLTLIAQRSDRVDIKTVGITTLKNPYIVVIVSSPANMKVRN